MKSLLWLSAIGFLVVIINDRGGQAAKNTLQLLSCFKKGLAVSNVAFLYIKTKMVLLFIKNKFLGNKEIAFTK